MGGGRGEASLPGGPALDLAHRQQAVGGDTLVGHDAEELAGLHPGPSATCLPGQGCLAEAYKRKFLRLTGSKGHDIVADATLRPIWRVTRLFPNDATHETPPAAQGFG